MKIDSDVLRKLLNCSEKTYDSEPIGDALLNAIAHLREIVSVCNQTLSSDSLAILVGSALGNEQGKRNTLIHIESNGNVVLTESNGEVISADRRSPIKVLRERAEQLGIEANKFGRDKLALIEAIQEVERKQVIVSPSTKSYGRRKDIMSDDITITTAPQIPKFNRE